MAGNVLGKLTSEAEMLDTVYGQSPRMRVHGFLFSPRMISSRGKRGSG